MRWTELCGKKDIQVLLLSNVRRDVDAFSKVMKYDYNFSFQQLTLQYYEEWIINLKIEWKENRKGWRANNWKIEFDFEWCKYDSNEGWQHLE